MEYVLLKYDSAMRNEVAELVTDAFRHLTMREVIGSLRRHSMLNLCAVTPDRQVAGVALSASLASGRHLWLDFLVVHPDFRWKGVGSTLLSSTELIAEYAGATGVHLGCNTANPVAQSFYKKKGYLDLGNRWDRPYGTYTEFNKTF